MGVTTQGSPVESRYLTSAILPARLSGLSSRGPAMVFDRNLSSPNASESLFSESGQSYTTPHQHHATRPPERPQTTGDTYNRATRREAHATAPATKGHEANGEKRAPPLAAAASGSWGCSHVRCTQAVTPRITRGREEPALSWGSDPGHFPPFSFMGNEFVGVLQKDKMRQVPEPGSSQ